MVGNRSLLAVLTLVFLIRALVPSGFMPDFSGKHAIQVCSGTEIKTIMVGDNGSSVPADHQKAHCPYSFLSTAFNEPPAYYPTITVPVLTAIDTLPAILVLDTHRFFLSPPSRAPPSLIA